jgi:hypothetical protein
MVASDITGSRAVIWIDSGEWIYGVDGMPRSIMLPDFPER